MFSIGATKKGARGCPSSPIRNKIGKIRSKMGGKVAKLGLFRGVVIGVVEAFSREGTFSGS